MITTEDYLNETDFDSLDEVHKVYINILILKINKFLDRCEIETVVTSGYRTKAHHLAIYKRINYKRKKAGLDPIKVPMGSNHLIGAAIDLYDPDNKLKKWIKENQEILVEFDFYCEHFSKTPNWVHIQILPPKSMSRFFYP